MSLVDLETFRTYLTTEEVSVASDEIMQDALDSAEESVQGHCGYPWRDFTPVTDATTATARSYVPSGGCVLRIKDCTDVESVTVDGVAITGYQLEPVNAAADGRPFEQIRYWSSFPISRAGEATVVVTAKWGWPAVPSNVEAAIKLAAKDDLASRKFEFGILAATDSGAVRALDNPQVVKKLVRLRRAETFGIA